MADAPEPGAPLAPPDQPSIAVLPFTNMSGDPEQEHFADGIAEDIIAALSKLPNLLVVARHRKPGPRIPDSAHFDEGALAILKRGRRDPPG